MLNPPLSSPNGSCSDDGSHVWYYHAADTGAEPPDWLPCYCGKLTWKDRKEVLKIADSWYEQAHRDPDPITYGTSTERVKEIAKGSWCPSCEIAIKVPSKVCGTCNVPTVPLPSEVVDKFLTEDMPMKKIDKGDIVAELI